MFREDYTSIEERPVTYSLRAGAGNSNGYYRAISDVADLFLENWEHEARSLREHYIEWLREGEREPLRDGREYTFDILTLGVMWRMYGGRVRQVPAPAALLCSALYRLRRSARLATPRHHRVASHRTRRPGGAATAGRWERTCLAGTARPPPYPRGVHRRRHS